jgi:iron complex transport system substrate-binding protein
MTSLIAKLIRLVALAIASGLMLAGDARAAPQRVASLNLCADQLVLLLADPGQVVSISWLSRDPDLSMMAEAAQAVPINRGLAEEVLPLRPDLVVGGTYTARGAATLLERFGIPVLKLDLPRDFDAIEEQIRTVAVALGHVERGEAIIAGMRRRLAAMPLPTGSQPVAAVYHPNGFTIGAGSLVDTMLRHAGFDNLAVRLGIDNYGQVPLEVLLANRPDVLIVDTDTGEAPSLARANLMHPALQRANIAVTAIPRRLWSCGLPAVIDAVELLAQWRERRRAERP